MKGTPCTPRQTAKGVLSADKSYGQPSLARFLLLINRRYCAQTEKVRIFAKI